MAHRSCRLAVLLLALVWGLSVDRPPLIFADGGGVITFGLSVRGDLTANERDTWTFRGQTGQVISIVAERDHSTTLDTVLTLLDPTNMPIFSAEGGGIGTDAALLGIVLPRDGLYAVVVTGNETVGAYQLTVAESVLPAGCNDLAPTIITDTWESAMTYQRRTYRVYLPPCYDETRRYPYILLLHGSDTTHTLWDQLGMDEAITVGVALNRVPPVALVLPDGGELANLDTFEASYSYESLLLNELLPLVEERYCLQTSGEGRAIGGISRGGFWAYTIGFRHPTRFVAIGGHSPVFYYSAYIPNSHNPLTVVQGLNPSDNLPRLWIDRGMRDWWAYNVDLMEPLLAQRNIPATVTIYPTGTHDNAYWRSHLNEYLAFYTADWSLENYPRCD